MKTRPLLLCAFVIAFISVQAQTYDIQLDSVGHDDYEYTIIPLYQIDSIGLYAGATNTSATAISNAKIMITGSVSDSMEFDSMAANVSKSDTLFFTPTTTGDLDFYFESVMSETDANLSNNKGEINITISDSVMARENGFATGGIGYNGGAGEIGNLFRTHKDDTLTSITFYIRTPTAGDSVRAHFRSYNNGVPGAALASTKAVALSTTQNWYTIRVCPLAISAGEYFVSVEQMVTGSNMSLGYTLNYFTDSTSYYNGGGGWNTIESAGFEATLLIRINLGETAPPPSLDITSNKDSICPTEYAFLQASSGYRWTWTPAAAALTPTGQTTLVSIDQSTTLTVTADYGCGVTQSADYFIYVKPAPQGSVSADTTICKGGTATLRASGGISYTWAGGTSNTDLVVSPEIPTAYTVQFNGANGCTSFKIVNVGISTSQVTAAGDTAVCFGETVEVSASGATTYEWENGATTATYSFDVEADDTLIVVGFNDLGCSAEDSVFVSLLPSPALEALRDTGACFTKYVTITAEGEADYFEWSNGSDSSSATVQALQAKYLYLRAYNSNGCEVFDTVFVDRYIPPFGTISPDTSVCAGDSIDLSAGGGSTYEWSNGMSGATIRVSPANETTYDVVIRSDKGCEDYESVKLSVNPLAQPLFTYKAYKDSVVFTSTSTQADSIRWNFGDGNSSTESPAYNIYDTSGSYTVTLTAYNDCGGVDSSVVINVVVPSTGSVEDILAASAWDIVPNPTSDNVQIRLTNAVYGKYTISLYDHHGQVLAEHDVIKSTQQFTHDLSLKDLSSGVYHIRVKHLNSVLNQMVIKH